MDDWDTVTKIGSKTGGGASQRETVVRGKGALNQAQRSGAIVGTEKKYATGNTVNKAGSEGQRLTKVDRADDIVPVQKTGSEIGAAIRARRSKEGQYKMTQAELAKKVNAQANDIKLLESGEGIKNQGLLNRVARVLKISPKTGKPLDEDK
ncbi:multiprotein-bridging factor 1 [Physcia stellaris]|nr:multiprotein-bridging factor 1 [Physcia stellaris]